MQGSTQLNPEYLELFSKLKSEILNANLEDLKALALKNLVYELKIPNDLAEMGVHMALNKVPIVRAFKEAGELFSVNQEQLAEYQKAGLSYKILIVQPFVLIQKER